MSNDIYLCGACECKTVEQANEWREKCEEWFSKKSDSMSVFNPNNHYNYASPMSTQKEIFRYELHILEKSKVVLVNLEDIRRSVGSITEIATAYNDRIPIIGFLSKKSIQTEQQLINYMHPWINEMCDKVFYGTDQAMIQAMEYINRNYYY